MENKNNIKKINITSKDSGDYFFYLFSENNINSTYDFIIQQNSTANLFFYVFSSENMQKYTININHAEKATSKCFVNVFTTKSGNVSLQINSIVDPNKIDVLSEQKIEGVLLSDDSTIEILPSMFVKSNKSITKHSVNIGKIDPEKIFYLECKGLYKKTAISEILKSMFFDLSLAKSPQVKCLYNKVMEKFNSFVK